MYLASVYSSSPSWPPSRPIPDCLTPPNGAAGSETTPRLIPTIPDSSAALTRRARTTRDRLLDELVDLLDGRGVDERADRGAGHPGAHGQGADRGAELLGELGDERAVHVETVRGRARLSAVAHLGEQGPRDRDVDVGVLEHEHGGVAAELHRARDDVVGSSLEQGPADLGRAREGEL